MSQNALSVQIRSATGKGVARRLRASGQIPGVCYRRNAESVAVTLDPHELSRLLSASAAGINTLFDLSVEGGGDFHGRQVLVRELQRDPVSGAFVHADLYAVDLAQAIEVSIPVHLVGTAVGVTLGGILDHSLREIEVECLPNAIPEGFDVDVTQLELGDSVHVRDVSLPEGVTLVSDPDLSVVSVVAPAAEEEAPAEAEAEAVEGEVPEGAAEGEGGEEPAKEATGEDAGGD